MRSGHFKASEEMGQSTITKLLIKFSTPSIISNLVSASYNLVDALFVAQLGAPLAGAVAPVTETSGLNDPKP